MVSAAAFTSREPPISHGPVRAKLALVARRRGGRSRMLLQGVDGARGGWPRQRREHDQGQRAAVPSPNPVQQGGDAGAFLAPSIQHGGSRARAGLGSDRRTSRTGRSADTLTRGANQRYPVPPQSYTITNWRIRPRRKFDGRQADDVQPNVGSGLVPLEPAACRSETGHQQLIRGRQENGTRNQHGRADLLACQCFRRPGRLQQRSWTAEDGSARSTAEVVAEELGPSLTGAP
jgi:hypothetical protein